MIAKIKHLLTKNKSKKNVEHSPCHDCDICCKYICMEIDKPKTEKDFDEIKWFLLHKDIWVYVDNDHSWNIQFNAKCEKLKNGLCQIYKKRPQICREHSHENCEKYGYGNPHKFLFKNLKELENWLEKREKI